MADRQLISLSRDAYLSQSSVIYCANIATGATTKNKHVKNARCIALSPDEDEIAVASESEGSFTLNASSLKFKHKLTSGRQYCIAYSPNGDWLATCYTSIVLFSKSFVDAQHYCLVSEKSSDDSEGHYTTIAFSPSSMLLATGSTTRVVSLQNVPDLAVLHTLRLHTDWVNSVVFLSDYILATASDDSTVRVWNCQDGLMTHYIFNHTRAVKALALSPNGTKLASGGWDARVVVYNTNPFGIINTIQCAHDVWQLCFVDDDVLAIGMEGDAILLLTAMSGDVVQTFEEKHGNPSGLIVTKGISELLL